MKHSSILRAALGYKEHQKLPVYQYRVIITPPLLHRKQLKVLADHVIKKIKQNLDHVQVQDATSGRCIHVLLHYAESDERTGHPRINRR